MHGCNPASWACRRLQRGSEHPGAAVLLNAAQTLLWPPSSMLLGIFASMFLLCRDHGGLRYLLLSACGVFFLLNLPEGIDVLEGLMEMSANPLN